MDMQRFVYLDAFADTGETQAMLLYMEVTADYLLIDDRRGCKVAKINQIKTVGPRFNHHPKLTMAPPPIR